jgi:catechol-2,3-dioxygenase
METIRPTLHHVTFKTSRLREMVAWYRAVVGAEVTFQDANNAWTTNDGANHRIAFLSLPALEDDPDKVKHNGMHHSAFEYGSFSDLMASYERLKGEGILPAFALDHGLTISLYYKDPEGNYVELQSDNFGDWKKSTGWMRTSPDFASNPIGTFFDPEKVSQAHAAGRPFDALQPAIRAGEFLPESIPSIGLPIPASPGPSAAAAA